MVISVILNFLTDGRWFSRLMEGWVWLLIFIVIIVAVVFAILVVGNANDESRLAYNAYKTALLEQYEDEKARVKNQNNKVKEEWNKKERQASSDLERKIDHQVGIDVGQPGWEDAWASDETQQTLFKITKILESAEDVVPAMDELPQLKAYELNSDMPSRYRYWMDISLAKLLLDSSSPKSKTKKE